MIDPAELAKMLVALLVMVDPIGVAPLFLALTSNYPDQRKKIANIAVITAVIVLVSGAILGQYILHLFGISLTSFRVFGGVLFLIMAIDMLYARPSRTKTTHEEETEAHSRKDTGVVPLGLPLLAGPGAISSVLISYKSAESIPMKAGVIIVILITGIITWITLRLSVKIATKLGQTGIAVMERIMGLMLGAIAVEFIFGGIKELLVSVR